MHNPGVFDRDRTKAYICVARKARTAEHQVFQTSVLTLGITGKSILDLNKDGDVEKFLKNFPHCWHVLSWLFKSQSSS